MKLYAVEMKLYAVAFISLFDNELKLEVIVAASEVEAAVKYLLNEYKHMQLDSYSDYLNNIAKDSRNAEEFNNRLSEEEFIRVMELGTISSS